jgi:hypothetical protein
MAAPFEPGLALGTIRERFLVNRDRLSDLAARVLEAIESGQHEAIASSWAEFGANVTAHLDEEQTAIIPTLFELRPRDVQGILQEHRHIRARLGDVHAAMSKGASFARPVRRFVDELRAHLRHEEAILF